MPGMRQPPPDALGIFTGFDIKYPEYTVVTPHMGHSYAVRCLNVSETNRLKSSTTTPAKATELINRTLWEAITSRPAEITDYETFLKKTSLRDREALLYAMYIVTFGDDREFVVACEECGTERTMKVRLSEMFSISPYPNSAAMVNSYQLDKISGDVDEPDPEMEAAVVQMKAQREADRKAVASAIQQAVAKPTTPSKEDLEKEDDLSSLGIGLGGPTAAKRPAPKAKPAQVLAPVGDVPGGMPASAVRVAPKANTEFGNILMVDVPVELSTPGLVCVIRQPSLHDELEILNNIPFLQKKQNELINETLIIKRFEKYVPGDTHPRQFVTEREDILRGYQMLPQPDKKLIYDKFREHFANYGISLKTNWDCLACSAENTMDLDISQQFFRMVSIS